MSRTGRDGFTLVEALVAFAIVAAATLVVQRGVVDARNGVGHTAARMAPEAIALSLLAEPLGNADLREGRRSGRTGGRRYDVRLVPLVNPLLNEESEEPKQNGGSPPRRPQQVTWIPVRVAISVETDSPDWLKVETVKLGRLTQ